MQFGPRQRRKGEKGGDTAGRQNPGVILDDFLFHGHDQQILPGRAAVGRGDGRAGRPAAPGQFVGRKGKLAFDLQAHNALQFVFGRGGQIQAAHRNAAGADGAEGPPARRPALLAEESAQAQGQSLAAEIGQPPVFTALDGEGKGVIAANGLERALADVNYKGLSVHGIGAFHKSSR